MQQFSTMQYGSYSYVQATPRCNNTPAGYKRKAKHTTRSAVRQSNRFFETIHRIGQQNGFDASDIVSCFERLQMSSASFALPAAPQHDAAADFLHEHRLHCNPQHFNLVWRALSEQYNLCSAAPFKPNPVAAAAPRERTLVYIAKQTTQDIVDSHQLLEECTLSNAARVYQYLNWTIRLSKLHGSVQTLESRRGHRILIINSELHCRCTREPLYMLCVPNDFDAAKSQKWQFVRLVTADDIRRFARYKRGQDLPRGVRGDAHQFEAYRFDELPSKADLLSSRIGRHQYAQLKGVQTQKNRQSEQASRKVLTLTASEVRQAVHWALQSGDARHEMIPIVSILSGKHHPDGDFSVDQVLPVQIGDGRDWIGVVFRHGLPQVTLIDAYDICNKAILCEPSFETSRLDFFVCRYNKVRIEPDAQSHAPMAMPAPWEETPEPAGRADIASYSPVSVSVSPSQQPSLSTSVSNMSLLSLSSASVSNCPSMTSTPVSVSSDASYVSYACATENARWTTDVAATIQYHQAQAKYFEQFLPNPAAFRL